MDIIASTDFKHGRVQFKKGKAYSVPEAVGGYFVGVGWAKEHQGGGAKAVAPELLGSDAPAKRKGDTLEVQDVKLKVKG